MSALAIGLGLALIVAVVLLARAYNELRQARELDARLADIAAAIREGRAA